ncbi:nascent polypeptide-associated complex subunit alpha, muscle-specific form-like [Cylas formicarius]|uniref:nascent polypeptide-associated complex subunit alpha, muscle-specific form-like n=1 Tax=Cylas formicarius TaxID=197179 RepID=UPI002958DF41|nr:nascent polypeptide-associated complex subunit alpha, muscle-specific form-like [Cylas formicarius]
MANKDDYLTNYREFFEYFAQTVDPCDQLPVKLASYKLVNVEVVGAVIDWTTQYLSQKNCPPYLYAPIIKIVIDEVRKACKKDPLAHGFNKEKNAYEPLKLMQSVMAKTNEVCLRYLDNSMLCSLPIPSGYYFPTSICSIRNRRRTMEDRHVVIHDLSTMFHLQDATPSSYYAIFDGHAGQDAAVYSSAHLHQFLAENRYFVSNPTQALLDAFCKTDALLLEKCKDEKLSSGTTAVVALLRPKEKVLYIAWAGDSQALLVNQGRVMQCVNPHKPNRQDERDRIMKAGGSCMMWYGVWRVSGQLAVSRAIGDANHKPFVIAIPDVREISLDGGEDFLIIACDGLWDFTSEDAAAQQVYDMLAEDSENIERVSKRLARWAQYRGSSDNISVIVVFLKEPSKIAAEAHRWANRNGPPFNTMDTGVDNANNPFTNSNGAVANDNIHLQKQNESLLLNITDNYKSNGTDHAADILRTENSNGKRSASEFDDDDFGPETDVDAIDEPILSPIEKTKSFNDGLSNNNPLEESYNPFLEHLEKAALETDSEIIIKPDKIETEDFSQDRRSPSLREETPTPPGETVHGPTDLEENQADSDSEDEWNYFKGDEAKKGNPSQPETVVECSEEDAMSQLNPNAAEFVPVSPTRSIPSPACRALINDEVIAQSSPKRPLNMDINVPSENDFDKEVKSRPSDVAALDNGHDESDSDLNTTPNDNMENLLNGKSIDEIPEFYPGSTPTKVLAASEEFHFGPNAAPFTPKLLDQSEAALSTKAVYGDESVATLDTSFSETFNKENNDPMSMSFSEERGDSNPFDLNKVQVLPDNFDDEKEEALDETISDLPEHYPLGKPLNNDDAIRSSGFDRLSKDDEKELASPLEQEIPDLEQESHLSKTPQPTEENLLGDFICNKTEVAIDASGISKSPHPVHSEVDVQNLLEPPFVSPLLEATENLVGDLLEPRTESRSPLDFSESKSALSESSKADSPLLPEISKADSPLCELPSSNSPLPDVTQLKLPETQSPVSDLPEIHSSKTPDQNESLSPCYKLPKEKLLDDDAVRTVTPDAVEEPREYRSEDMFDTEVSSKPPEDLEPIPIESPILTCDLQASHFPSVEAYEMKSPDDLLIDSGKVELAEYTIYDISPAEFITKDASTTVDYLEEKQTQAQVHSSYPSAIENLSNIGDVQQDIAILPVTSDSLKPVDDILSSNGEAALSEQIAIKTENIIPEFAEQTVLTPSEEDNKQVSDKPLILETLSQEPEELEKAEEVVATVAIQEEIKNEEKKSTTLAKKPALGKVGPSKTSQKYPLSPKVAPTKPTISPRVPPKTGSVKPPVAKTTQPKTSPKPKTISSTTTAKLTSRTSDSKLTNGESKAATARTTAIARKPVGEPAATKAMPKASPSSGKPSLVKTSRPVTAPKTVPPLSKTSTLRLGTTTATAKPKPATATSKNATATSKPSIGAPTKLSSAAPKTLSVSPKPSTTVPLAKPRTLTSAAPKPRVPLTKTITKSADVEKQHKESANKLTASRTTTTKTSTQSASSRTTSTTVKKTEIKPTTTNRTAAKTTTTTAKSTLGKKPGEVKSVSKTKTTKIEKPKENGVSATIVTEEITVVNNMVNELESQLLKDNSPIDNKLTVESALIGVNNAD